MGARGDSVNVDAENPAEKPGIDDLAGIKTVVRAAEITEAHVERTVVAEKDGAPVVPVVGVILLDEDHFRVRVDDAAGDREARESDVRLDLHLLSHPGDHGPIAQVQIVAVSENPTGRTVDGRPATSSHGDALLRACRDVEEERALALGHGGVVVESLDRCPVLDHDETLRRRLEREEDRVDGERLGKALTRRHCPSAVEPGLRFGRDPSRNAPIGCGESRP
jgi:hypothetical protein